MGKYGASVIHEWFSEWHIHKCASTSYLTDLDRLWVETRNHKVVCVFDLKWKWSFESGLDSITYGEKITIKFFEEHGVPYYILIIDASIKPIVFEIHRPQINFAVNLTEKELMAWINNNCNFVKLPKPVRKLEKFM